MLLPGRFYTTKTVRRVSRIPGDTRELVARVYGVERAGAVTYQSVQTELNGKPLRLFLIGFEHDRPGGPRKLLAGRDILRSHYEMIVDRSAGLALGQEVPLGTHGHKFTVVGLMRDELTSAGDPVGYITLHDAQALQFELSPAAERREVSRGGGCNRATRSMLSSPRCRPMCRSTRLPPRFRVGSTSRH